MPPAEQKSLSRHRGQNDCRDHISTAPRAGVVAALRQAGPSVRSVWLPGRLSPLLRLGELGYLVMLVCRFERQAVDEKAVQARLRQPARPEGADVDVGLLDLLGLARAQASACC